jgi:hypothetical protein
MIMIKRRRMRWAGHAACMTEKTSSYGDFAGNTGGNRLLERHRYRWKNNIKMDYREIGWEL